MSGTKRQKAEVVALNVGLAAESGDRSRHPNDRFGGWRNIDHHSYGEEDQWPATDVAGNGDS
jgi:hypothetical protein